MTSFGNGVIAEVISYVRVRSLGWALIQYDCSLIKRGHLDTDMHTSCENEGGDQGDASTGQRTPEIVSKPPDAGGEGWWGEAWQILPHRPRKEPSLPTP